MKPPEMKSQYVWPDAIKVPSLGNLDDLQPHHQLHLAFDRDLTIETLPRIALSHCLEYFFSVHLNNKYEGLLRKMKPKGLIFT